MSHWNHRIIRKTYPCGSVILGIHEVFCDDEGRVWAASEEPIAPTVVEKYPSPMSADLGETVDDLKTVLGWMLEALTAPILDFDSIPEEGVDDPLEDIDLDNVDSRP